MSMFLPFHQVDVFAPGPLPGNPLAVVHDADALSDRQMQAFANWTNLSETTFLLAPTSGEADYRLRIFTPTRELPFAGHPTLGSAHAWLEAGGRPAHRETITQESASGLVALRRSADRISFAAPPLVRDEQADEKTLCSITELLGADASRIEAARWIDNGPGWVGIVFKSADDVLGLKPQMAEIAKSGFKIGVAGFFDHSGAPADLEVRAFGSGDGSSEDPVTGSLNAGFAQWLIRDGRAPRSYVARQGTVLGRGGMIHVEKKGEDVWIGGATRTIISGTMRPLA
ncbi:PhzF family phenazine biosynthesis protein [Rothia uropygioeca]|uniref:PhzF family phenazine biosynthesis protein n=1 Tax=Kocuria sp. 257 TaxID=2021970 RepID=UPI00192D3118|nr:PhzF family phenazine biosynthesis protein [Kocuria sp. 257]